jgi:hypothetical protein
MRRLVLLLGLFLIALPATSAQAESFPVTTTADAGAGSLRAAIEEANTFDEGEVDKIPIQVSGVIELETALPPIVESVHIAGPGPGTLEIARAAIADDFRIFATGPLTNVAFKGLTVSDGVDRFGGGIYGGGEVVLDHVVIARNEATDFGGENAIARGGGVFAEDWLVIRDSVIRDNRVIATGGSAETVATGGGISSAEELTMERSTIAGNLAEARADAGAEALALGGGAQILHATIYTSTFSGNSVLAEEGTTLNDGSGGGIQGAEGQLFGLTVNGNSASASGANLDLNLDSMVRDSIVAEPLGNGESCANRLPSDGFNLDEDSSCEFGEATDLEAVDPMLGPLTDNGGPTPTHALLPGSAAIDRGSAFGSTVDQRGLKRPVDLGTVSNAEGGDGSDIGAFELQAPARPGLTPIPVSQVPTDRTPPNTRVVSGPPRMTFKRLAKFRFASSEAQSTFQCRVDSKPWRGCRNPYKRKVSGGRKHVFRVRAIDRFGNVDPTPARFGWRVKKIVG